MVYRITEGKKHKLVPALVETRVVQFQLKEKDSDIPLQTFDTHNACFRAKRGASDLRCEAVFVKR